MQEERLDHFNKFASEVIGLSDLVKCPICLEILNNPVELSCTHIFCKCCIENCSKRKQFCCPVCQKIVSKRTFTHAKELEEAIVFVTSICNKIKNSADINLLPPDKCQPNVGDKLEQIKPIITSTINLHKKPRTRKQHEMRMTTKFDEGEKKEEYVLKWLANTQNLFDEVSESTYDMIAANDSLQNPVLDSANRYPSTALQTSDKELKQDLRTLDLITDNRTGDSVLGRDSLIPTINTPNEDLRIENINTNTVTKSSVLREIDRTNHDQQIKKRKLPDKGTLNISTRPDWRHLHKVAKHIEKTDADPKKLKVPKIIKRNIEPKTGILNIEYSENNEQKSPSPVRKTPQEQAKKVPVGNVLQEIEISEQSLNIQNYGDIQGPLDQDDDMFMLATQPVTLTKPEDNSKDEERHMNKLCGEFINHYSGLKSKLGQFLSTREEISHKFDAIQKSLKMCEPKISAIKNLLNGDEIDVIEHAVSKSVQTEGLSAENIMLQTSLTPRKPDTINVGVQIEIPLSKIHTQGVFSNTLDFCNFDTQAAVNAAEQRNILSEMPVSEIIRNLDADAKEVRDLSSNLQSLQNKTNIATRDISQSPGPSKNVPRKSIYQIDSSPESPIPNKKVAKPLPPIDSEGDVLEKLRPQISLKFATQSEDDLPSADKYADDVWRRLEEQFNSSKVGTVDQKDADNEPQKESSFNLSSNRNLPKPTVAKPNLLEADPTLGAQKVSSVNLITDSIFDDDDDLFNDFLTPVTSSIDKPKSTLHNVHSDVIYKDSNSSISNRIFDEQPSHNAAHQPAVTILQDVRILPSTSEKNEVIDIIDSDEEECFGTPEKSFKRLSCSPRIELIPPPASFQDIEPPPGNKFPENTPKFDQPWNPMTFDSLALSPIPKRQQSLSAMPNLSLKRVTSTPHSKHPKPTTSHHFVRKASQAPALNDIEDEELFEERSKQAVVSCSRLEKIQIHTVTRLAICKLVNYTNVFDSSVTHLVVSTKDGNCAKDHTIKYLRAVAAGIWVVNINWVQECLKSEKLVPEEPYEVFDVSGEPGPRISRLNRHSKPLLKDFKVYLSPPFDNIPPNEVQDVITVLGGTTISSPENFEPKENHICIIIGEIRPTQELHTYDKYEQWLANYGVITVDIEWLSRSIGQFKLMNLRRFILCSDDTITTLGYPSELIEAVMLSFTPHSS